MTSIRRYLSVTLIAGLIVCTLIAVLAAYLTTRHKMEEIFDAQLSLQARIIASIVDANTTSEDYAEIAAELSQPGRSAREYAAAHADGSEAKGTSRVEPRLFGDEERMLSVGFWTHEGRPILMGARWHDHDTTFPPPSRVGHRWVEYFGHTWRVFDLSTPDGRWLSVGLRDAFPRKLSNEVVLGNFIPLLLALPLLIWLIARLIRRGLKPIGHFSHQVETRDEKDFSAIVVDVPVELDALRSALNGFIKRLEQTLERERRFTADAAHELRTPLAAMKIHLDNARFGEPTALDKAYNGIERLQRVVEQLLLLARLDIHQQPAVPESVVLEPLVLDLAADLWPLAETQHQSLNIAEGNEVRVEGNPTELGILIRNLMDNALRYTPEGGSVSVDKGYDERGRPWLAISDSGPGIPDALLEAVTQRFQRASDQRISGSGLGLAIAAEIAERQRLTLTLENRTEGGLRVCLTWWDAVAPD